MLRSAVLVASLASVALSGVTNFCVEEPFRQMQEFRGFDPAMSRCEAHYPAQTILKVLPNKCLTTTQTVILGTSTVHATNHLACPTAHLEIRGDDLEERDDDLVERADGTRRAKKQEKKAKQKAKKEKLKSKLQAQKSKLSKYKANHPKTTTTSPLPVSVYPRDLHLERRGAGPTPAAVLKRDAQATKSADWSNYYASLVECGYDCIQTACSCVASPKIELQTPSPTCTSTKIKETVVHVTKTIDVEPTQC